MSSFGATHIFQCNNQIQYDEQNKPQLTASRSKLLNVCANIRTAIPSLFMKRGVHSAIQLRAAGFEYTGTGDTARCYTCQLEVSNWTADMNPFDIHAEHSPRCQFIRSIKVSSTTVSSRNTLTLDGRQDPSKRQKIETTNLVIQTNTSLEADRIKEARERTFLPWSHHDALSDEKMAKAGFFNCHVGDRVTCLYCNVICQQWTPNVDNPFDVHKTLSPNCPYVKANLTNDTLRPILNSDQTSASTTSVPFSEGLRPMRPKKILRKIRKPTTTVSTTSDDSIASINDLIVGDLLDADIKAIKECVYCKKSLQKMDDNHVPTIKRAQWLVHCVHRESNDEDELYHKSEGPKRTRNQNHTPSRTRNSGVMANNNSSTVHSKLSSCDRRIISRLIGVGFNLPISARLLNKDLKFINDNLINRLQIAEIDSTSEVDLLIACILIQKQIDYIDGQIEKLIVPSERMYEIDQQNRQEAAEDLKRIKASKTTSTIDRTQSTDVIESTLCIVCLTEEKKIACLPCGHWLTCVPCGHALQFCPLCRQDIKAFVRVYP